MTEEYWDLFTKDNKKTPHIHIRGEKVPEGLYHRMVEGWVRTSDRHILIQQRSSNKKIYPNYWSCSAIGSVLQGETPEEGMIRELREEVGLEINSKDLELAEIITDHPCHFYIYRIEKDFKIEDLILDREEVQDVALLTLDELKEWVETGKLVQLSYYKNFFETWD